MAERRPPPTLDWEASLGLGNGDVVVGMDEVGRGAWAGPLTVGAVAIAWPPSTPPAGVADSKLLRPEVRRALVEPIAAWAIATSTGWASPQECDAFGMTEATALATFRALDALGLSVPPDVVLFDGVVDPLSGRLELGRFASPAVATRAGADRTSALVAAASVVAKVARDDAMVELDESFPAFGFASNKGYPSDGHRMALLGYGLTAIHRRSWRYTEDWVIGGVS